MFHPFFRLDEVNTQVPQKFSHSVFMLRKDSSQIHDWGFFLSLSLSLLSLCPSPPPNSRKEEGMEVGTFYVFSQLQKLCTVIPETGAQVVQGLIRQTLSFYLFHSFCTYTDTHRCSQWYTHTAHTPSSTNYSPKLIPLLMIHQVTSRWVNPLERCFMMLIEPHSLEVDFCLLCFLLYTTCSSWLYTLPICRNLLLHRTLLSWSCCYVIYLIFWHLLNQIYFWYLWLLFTKMSSSNMLSNIYSELLYLPYQFYFSDLCWPKCVDLNVVQFEKLFLHEQTV